MPAPAREMSALSPVMGSARVVRRLFELMEERAWEDAASCLAADVEIDWPVTGEHFSGTEYLDMNRVYPGEWSLAVVETVHEGGRVAARLRVDHEGVVFWCAGFYTVEEGAITRGVEYWISEGSADPPDWRHRFP